MAVKNSGEILNKLKSKGFLASSVSKYDFSDSYTLPHNLINEKLTELIEQTLKREGSLYLACNEERAFVLLLNNLKDGCKLWSFQMDCDDLHYLGQYIYKIRLKIV